MRTAKLRFSAVLSITTAFILAYPQQSLALRPSSIGRPDFMYTKNLLSVCFLNNTDFDFTHVTLNIQESEYLKSHSGEKPVKLFPNAFMKLIKDAVQLSFAPQSSGVSFTGFEDCNNSQNSDVILLMDDQADPTFEASLLGDPRKHGKEFLKTPVNSIVFHSGLLSIDKKNRQAQRDMLQRMGIFNMDQRVHELADRMLSISVVHEFMHVLGYEHEFYQKSGIGLLKNFDLSEDFEESGSLVKEAREYWSHGARGIDLAPFDIFSSMNYQKQRFMFFALNAEAICKTKISKLTLLERSELCDESMLSAFAMDSSAKRTYLSDGDIAGLHKVFLHEDLDPQWVSANQKTMNWLALVKPVFERELAQFK